MKLMSPSHARFTAALFLTTLAGSLPAISQIIYQDSFTRTGILGGTSPDVINTGGAVWTSTATTDGLIATTSTSLSYLPFSPVLGTVYTLSLNLSQLTSQRWSAFGFSNGNTTTGPFHTTNSPVAWMLLRAPISQDGNNGIQLFGGPGAASAQGNAGPGIQGSVYTITLDTTAPAWTYSFAGAGITTTTFTFATNPTISFVGFGTDNGGNGNFDNFTLTAIPEPSTYVLLLAGSCFAVIVYRRNRKQA